MRYIKTAPMSVRLYEKQREIIEEVQGKIKQRYNIHIPFTELIRICVEDGIGTIEKEEEWDSIMERIR
ncbi:MAG: hypothetical protein DDT40_01763 [candidate division WS2 bacterium]|nr:hypothetical protein [Candidatus Psychracetigena formicireducens]